MGSSITTHTFSCQMYIGRRGTMSFALPAESGPQRVARLEPIEHAELIDPSFRRLIAAFESLPTSLQTVQV